MNIKVRVKNPWFWIGLVGVIFTAMGVSPEMFTDWTILANSIIDLVSNPFMLFSVIIAVLGIFVDPTTSSLKDSTRALSYDKPHKDDNNGRLS